MKALNTPDDITEEHRAVVRDFVKTGNIIKFSNLVMAARDRGVLFHGLGPKLFQDAYRKAMEVCRP